MDSRVIKLLTEANSEKYCNPAGITQSLHFPRSFLADMKYLVLQNIAPLLYGVWS